MKKMLLASTSTIHGQKYLEYILEEVSLLFYKCKNILFSTGQKKRQLLAAKIGDMQLYIIGGSLLPQTSKNSQKRPFRRRAEPISWERNSEKAHGG